MQANLKKICVWATKGGVGKSTVTANVGLALKRKELRVGYLDIDCTGSNLPTALGIQKPFPRVGLDTAREKMLAVKINGDEIFSLSFRFGSAALMWRGGEEKIHAFGREFEMRGTGRYELVKRMLTNVEFSDELDYLLLDLPPSSGDETLSLFEHIEDLWGAILVCQPTNLAVEDIERTLNMVEVKKIPLLGMVGNMTYAIAPKSREEFCPFLDAGVDLEQFCQQRRIPYLASIPLTPEKELIDIKFNELANKVIEAKPVKIWERSFQQKLQDAAVKGTIKALFGKET